MKYKYIYIYILESVRHFYIKGCRGGSGQLKELGYIMRQNITKYNKNKKNQYKKLEQNKNQKMILQPFVL